MAAGATTNGCGTEPVRANSKNLVREGMLDHEIERRMEELNAKVLSLNSNVIPLKRA
jgi:hypothetical protein